MGPCRHPSRARLERDGRTTAARGDRACGCERRGAIRIWKTMWVWMWEWVWEKGGCEILKKRVAQCTLLESLAERSEREARGSVSWCRNKCG